MDGFIMIHDTTLSPPGDASSMYKSQLISGYPMRLGFPHRVGRFRPGETSLSPPVCQRDVDTFEIFLRRGWGRMFPG